MTPKERIRLTERLFEQGIADDLVLAANKNTALLRELTGLSPEALRDLDARWRVEGERWRRALAVGVTIDGRPDYTRREFQYDAALSPTVTLLAPAGTRAARVTVGGKPYTRTVVVHDQAGLPTTQYLPAEALTFSAAEDES